MIKNNLLVRNIPNLISVFRILCSALFLTSISYNFRTLAFIVLLFGSISDFFDGYIARKLNITSKLGELLDPFADKIFANTVLWSIYLFCGRSINILIIALLLTLRDVLLVIGSTVALLRRIKTNIKPIFLSKLCTTLIFVLCLVSTVYSNNCLYIRVLEYTCIILIIMTSILYLRRLKYHS